MIKRNNTDQIIQSKNQHNGLLTGMFLGFLGYVAFDFYRDEKRRKNLTKDLKEFSSDVQPYVTALKEKAESSPELSKALKEFDSAFGTSVHGYVMQAVETKKEEPAKKSVTSSIGKFFKRK
jgi:predicted negative regulator of RcsB-dependent stress response